MFCYNCGAKNEDEALFCAECGTRLEDAYDGNEGYKNNDTYETNKLPEEQVIEPEVRDYGLSEASNNILIEDENSNSITEESYIDIEDVVDVENIEETSPRSTVEETSANMQDTQMYDYPNEAQNTQLYSVPDEIEIPSPEYNNDYTNHGYNNGYTDHGYNNGYTDHGYNNGYTDHGQTPYNPYDNGQDYNPYGQVTDGQYGKKKDDNKKTIIIVSIVSALVLLIGLGVGIFLFLQNQDANDDSEKTSKSDRDKSKDKDKDKDKKVYTNDYLTDESGLFSSTEYDSLINMLKEKSKSENFDIIVLIKKSIGDDSIRDIADGYYKSNDYGYGTGKDGTLLLIDVDSKEVYLYTSGEAKTILSSSDISSIESDCKSDLKNKEYYQMICDYYNAVSRKLSSRQKEEPTTKTLSAPTNLVATPYDSESIDLEWSSVNGATSYAVYNANGILEKDNIKGTFYRVTGLQTYQSYTYYVVATDGYVVSAASNRATSTTLYGEEGPSVAEELWGYEDGLEYEGEWYVVDLGQDDWKINVRSKPNAKNKKSVLYKANDGDEFYVEYIYNDIWAVCYDDSYGYVFISMYDNADKSKSRILKEE